VKILTGQLAEGGSFSVRLTALGGSIMIAGVWLHYWFDELKGNERGDK
jgi:hypothetical protein